MIVNIQDKEITIKYGFRSLMVYERIAGKTFTPETTSDVIIFLYACLAAGDVEFTMPFDDYINWLDDNPKVLEEFGTFLIDEFTRQQEMKPKEDKKKSIRKAQKK